MSLEVPNDHLRLFTVYPYDFQGFAPGLSEWDMSDYRLRYHMLGRDITSPYDSITTVIRVLKKYHGLAQVQAVQ